MSYIAQPVIKRLGAKNKGGDFLCLKTYSKQNAQNVKVAKLPPLKRALPARLIETY